MYIYINKDTNSIENHIDTLDKPFQSYLFYKTWEYKEKIIGIHDDFGRLSILNKVIPCNYYCNLQDKADITLEIISLINNMILTIKP